MEFDPVILSRLQFGLTASFHIIFPCLVIGLAFYLAIQEFLWLKTKKKIYLIQYQFWLKPFTVVFLIGMITGVVLSYQLDTSFAGFYEKTASILVPIRNIELVNVILLEGGTLGIMIWGWQRVGKRLHFTATLMMVLGVLISAVCITARNSWMQTPDGFSLINDQIIIHDWASAVFNPSFPYRFSHMLVAAFLSSAFFILGISAWFLIKKQHRYFARHSLRFSLIAVIIITPVQIFLGHLHGMNTHEYQPLKIAAIEGLWQTQKGAPMVLFGIPDQENEYNRHSLEIPKLASLIITHDINSELIGLKETPKMERPNVPIVFFSFRIMVIISIFMLITGLTGLVLIKKKRLYHNDWFLRMCIAMMPSGLVATIAGWCVSEVGRQPWTVTGLLKTTDIVTSTPGTRIIEFMSYIGAFYIFLFSFFIYSIRRFIKHGPRRVYASCL